MGHFWGAGLLYTGVNFENKHGFSPGTLCKSILALLKEIALVSPYPVGTGRKLSVHKTFRRHPGRLLNVLCTFNLRPVSSGYVVIIKKSFDVQLQYHSQFKIWVSLEEHQGFYKLPLKVSQRSLSLEQFSHMPWSWTSSLT